jgi:hypothetical protein
MQEKTAKQWQQKLRLTKNNHNSGLSFNALFLSAAMDSDGISTINATLPMANGFCNSSEDSFDPSYFCFAGVTVSLRISSQGVELLGSQFQIHAHTSFSAKGVTHGTNIAMHQAATNA